MSTKWYEQLAGILREEQAPAEIVTRVAELLQEENPRFDKEKFLLACILEGAAI